MSGNDCEIVCGVCSLVHDWALGAGALGLKSIVGDDCLKCAMNSPQPALPVEEGGLVLLSVAAVCISPAQKGLVLTRSREIYMLLG